MSKGRTIKKPCIICNTVFDAEIKELNRGNAKFCGRECFHKHRKQNKKPKEPNCKCAQCEKPIYKRPSKIKASKSGLVFCDRACKEAAQKIGGIKEIQPSHYTNVRKNYRVTAKENLPNCCAECGYDKYPEVLQVHHIDRDRSNNDIENLVILCPTCHEVDHFLSNDGRFS